MRKRHSPQALMLVVVLASSLGLHPSRSLAAQQPPDNAGTLPPKQKHPERMSVSGDVLQKMLVSKTDPAYPAEAVARNVGGPVVLSVVLDQDGSVADAKYRCGVPLLMPAVLDAVRQWKYSPAVYQGKRVEVSGEVTVDLKPPNLSQSTSRLFVNLTTAEANLLSAPPPRYPRDTEMGRIQGCVVIHCDIGSDGNVQSTKIVSGHPMLTAAAEVAAHNRRYKPFVKYGAPVEAETYVIESFALK